MPPDALDDGDGSLAFLDLNPPLFPLFFFSSPNTNRAIPHPIYRFEGAEVCLIVKDAPGGSDGKTTASNKAAKAKARNQKLAEAAGVSKVIAVSKLKSKYEPHEAKRALANAFDLFLADARVLPSLARLLGKSFFRAKKQPVPVDLRGKDWRTPVADAVRATYYYRGGGSCVNVRVARSSFTVRQVTENVEAALRNLVPKLSATGAGGKWSGVRSVLLKSAASVALPVYQSGPRGVEEEEGDEEEEKEKVVVEKKKKAVKETAAAEKTTTTATKKKKASSALDEGAAKKKKKASSALDEGAAKKKKKTTARA